MIEAIELLKEQEWSMGNGQCPFCYGVHAGWVGHPRHLNGKTVGHKDDCKLAAALKSLGVAPLMIGECTDTREFEEAISAGGFYTTQLVGTDPAARGRYEQKMAEMAAHTRNLLCGIVDQIIIETLKGGDKNGKSGSSETKH